MNSVFSEVSVHKLTVGNRPDVKAVASVTVGGAIRLTSIKLYQLAGGEFTIKTPKKGDAQKTWDFFFPINAAVRKELTDLIAKAYQELPPSV